MLEKLLESHKTGFQGLKTQTQSQKAETFCFNEATNYTTTPWHLDTTPNFFGREILQKKAKIPAQAQRFQESETPKTKLLMQCKSVHFCHIANNNSSPFVYWIFISVSALSAKITITEMQLYK